MIETDPRPAQIELSADVDPCALIASGTHVWHLAQVREHAQVGHDCSIGRGVYVGPGVVIGDRCKIQNYALVYEPSVLGDGVFIGPGAVLTNDCFPRAVNSDGTPKRPQDWDAVAVTIGEGASIGARVVCIAPVTIGRWAMVAAGAVVTRDVPDFALVAGNPARFLGWIGRDGYPLVQRSPGRYECPVSGRRYEEQDDRLHELPDLH